MQRMGYANKTQAKQKLNEIIVNLIYKIFYVFRALNILLSAVSRIQ